MVMDWVARIQSLAKTEIEKFLSNRHRPSSRRHFISIENNGVDLKVTIVIFGMFFWEITIPNFNLELDNKLEEELFLDKLSTISADKAGNTMYIDNKTIIELKLD